MTFLFPMKKIFSLDGPYYRVMTLITNLLILNIMFLLSAATVVLFGPGLIALYSISQGLIDGNENNLIRSYVIEVKHNFKRGILLFLIIVVGLGGTVGLAYFAAMLNPIVAPILIFFLTIVILLLGTFIYAFSNSDETVSVTLKKSLYLIMRRIIYSIAILVIPVLVIWAAGKIGFFIELSFGFSVACFVQQIFVHKVGIEI